MPGQSNAPATPAAQPARTERAPSSGPTIADRLASGTKWSFNKIWGIGSYFKNVVKSVLGGAWKATGAQPLEELGIVGQRLGFENPEAGQGLFREIGGIIRGVSDKVANALGGTVDYVAGMPGRIVQRPLQGLQYAWDTLFGVKREGKKEAGGPSVPHGAVPSHA